MLKGKSWEGWAGGPFETTAHPAEDVPSEARGLGVGPPTLLVSGTARGGGGRRLLSTQAVVGWGWVSD